MNHVRALLVERKGSETHRLPGVHVTGASHYSADGGGEGFSKKARDPDRVRPRALF
jgi:hypothetical protein